MRKSQWARSTNGPDWTDVEMMMRALGALHSAEVAIVISPSGLGSSGGVNVAASAIFNVLPGSALPASVVVNQDWPCNAHATLVGHAFNALHVLDYRIGQTYKNEKLWE